MKIEGIAGIEVRDRDAVEMRGGVTDFVVVRTAVDDVGAAAGLDQVVEDAALDDLAEARAFDQILLVRVEAIDRNPGRIGGLPVAGRGTPGCCLERQSNRGPGSAAHRFAPRCPSQSLWRLLTRDTR